MRIKQRLMGTTMLGLPRVDVRKALASGFPQPEEAHARLVAAADKRARRHARNLQLIAAGGCYAPPRRASLGEAS